MGSWVGTKSMGSWYGELGRDKKYGELGREKKFSLLYGYKAPTLFRNLQKEVFNLQ
jgi:hypothetical protein